MRTEAIVARDGVLTDGLFATGIGQHGTFINVCNKELITIRRHHIN